MNVFAARLTRVLASAAVAAGISTTAWAGVPWLALGPYGGDARSFAADPQNPSHLFLGSATGWIYRSTDGGRSWERLSRVGKRDDLVLDHILVDPSDAKHVIVAAWVLDHPDGGLYDSHDGGASWTVVPQMRGQSVRALASAPSDPRMLIAGTLEGVYRSADFGGHWTLISPVGSTEIHEVESLAFDPVNPQIMYAGTWHLPWKTMDGGAHWASINKGNGFIDDSDVFSIIVDPRNPEVVYASACSGIYKSEDGGVRFRGGTSENRAQGIPLSARRTRKLLQDPKQESVVFAGTTEGLYRTANAGANWARMTGPEVIVNDVFIDPTNTQHVLVATDRGGVLLSDDGGLTYALSNDGFSARQVTSFGQDPKRPAVVYAGLVNDKTAGGVFMSNDGGVHWSQQSAGLGGRDVFSLATLDSGSVLAGTGHGIFRSDAGGWNSSSTLLPSAAVATASAEPMAHPVAAKKTGAAGKAAVPRKPAAAKTPPATQLDAIVYAIVPSDGVVYAGTSQGLLSSTTDGRQWMTVDSLQMPETRFVGARKNIVMAAGLRRIALSVDSGKTWDAVAIPAVMTQISTVTVDELGNLWVGGREGVFYSTDYGLNWKTLQNLYMTHVSDVYFDAANHRVLVTASNSSMIFAAHLPDYKVSYFDSGWDLRFVRSVGDHFIGASLFDGMVVQPVMVDTQVTANHGGR